MPNQEDAKLIWVKLKFNKIKIVFLNQDFII